MSYEIIKTAGISDSAGDITMTISHKERGLLRGLGLMLAECSQKGIVRADEDSVEGICAFLNRMEETSNPEGYRAVIDALKTEGAGNA